MLFSRAEQQWAMICRDCQKVLQVYTSANDFLAARLEHEQAVAKETEKALSAVRDEDEKTSRP